MNITITCDKCGTLLKTMHGVGVEDLGVVDEVDVRCEHCVGEMEKDLTVVFGSGVVEDLAADIYHSYHGRGDGFGEEDYPTGQLPWTRMSLYHDDAVVDAFREAAISAAATLKMRLPTLQNLG